MLLQGSNVNKAEDVHAQAESSSSADIGRRAYRDRLQGEPLCVKLLARLNRLAIGGNHDACAFGATLILYMGRPLFVDGNGVLAVHAAESVGYVRGYAYQP